MLGDLAQGGGAYPDTSWTLIEQAGAGRPEALTRFRSLYYWPVRACAAALARGTPLDADELANDFFTDQVWAGQVLRSADPARGRFRHFLKRCVRNYVLSARRKLQAGGARLSRLGPEEAASSVLDTVCFDIEWARALLERAIQRARDVCEAKGQRVHFEVFRRRFLAETNEAPEWAEAGLDLRGLEGMTLSLAAREARSHAETVIRHVRRALLAELELETGSLETAEEELSTLLAILEAHFER